MKIFPIKVEKAIKSDMKFIEWKIHNVCNYDCSFCGDKHKDGSQRWLTLEQYKEFADKLIKACLGKPFWIQFTGGEPTLFPKLIELMQYAKSHGAMISLVSNGSRTIRWWKELKEAKVLDYLFLSYHSEQTDNYHHIVEVINLFHDEPIEVLCLMTHTINSLDKVFKAQEYIVENTGAMITLKSMIISDYNIYDYYLADELTKLKKLNWVYGKLRNTKNSTILPPKLRINHDLQITYNTGTNIKIDPQILMKNQKNSFLDWECNIGAQNMRIDYDKIYRGVCEVGGNSNITDNVINFANDYVTCTKKDCVCSIDLIATKMLPKSKYPKL